MGKDIPFILQNTAPQVNFMPELCIFDLPVAYTSITKLRETLDDATFIKMINAVYEKKGFRLLGMGDQSFRVMTTNKKIQTLQDFKGQKIRTMENKYHIAFWQSIHANPTPMTFSEVYIGLQQGTIDAQENPLQIISSSRFYEVQDYLTISGHFFATGSLLFNKDFVDKLPDDLREILYDCARESTIYGRELVAEMEADYLEELKANGMEVNVLTDEQKQLFIDKSKQVYEKYEDVLGKRSD